MAQDTEIRASRLKELAPKLSQLADFFEQFFPNDTEDGREDLRWLSTELPKLMEEMELSQEHSGHLINDVVNLEQQLTVSQAEVVELHWKLDSSIKIQQKDYQAWEKSQAEVVAEKHYAGDMADQARMAQAEVAQLKAAFKRYGSHDGNCDRGLHCKCGLFQALATDTSHEEE